jgi:hypothetical protein
MSVKPLSAATSTRVPVYVSSLGVGLTVDNSSILVDTQLNSIKIGTLDCGLF